jgi:DNA-binding transcriptional MerR regulator
VEEYSRLRKQGDSTIPQRLEMLYSQRERLQSKMRELQEQMSFIDRKIDTYQRMMRHRGALRPNIHHGSMHIGPAASPRS